MDRRLKIKTSRRKIYSEINPESIDRIGQQCSPYQALKLAVTYNHAIREISTQ